MANKKVLSKAVAELNKAKAPTKTKDIIYDPRGQWEYPGQVTRIPGNDITMQGVNYPVWAQPSVGPGMLMIPGQDYNFPGADYVDEYPQMQEDYIETELSPEEIQLYRDGGYIVEDISVPELQDGGEEPQLNLDLPEQTVYANESKRKLQGSLIDKLSQVKNAYQDYRENAGLTKLRLKNEGVSSIDALKRNIKEYKTQLEEEKKSFDRAQKALNVLQKKDPKAWENKKLKDVMSAQGVDALRSLYKEGKISNESFIDFYNNFGKQFDREAVKTSAEDQVKLEDSWYGKKDKQGRRTWMSNPMNVAKIAQGVAIGAPLAPLAAMAAPAIASGTSSLIPAAQTALNASMLGVPGLTANNLLWGAGAYASANEVMDPESATRTSINRAIKDPTLSNIGKATGNTAMTALGFAGIPVKTGVASLADDVTQTGKYLTRQTSRELPNFSNSPVNNVPKNITQLTNTGFKKDPYYHYPKFLEKQQEVLEAINTSEGRKRLQGYIDRNPHLQNKTVDDIINHFRQTSFETKSPKVNPTGDDWIRGDDGYPKLFDVDPNNAYNWYREGYNKPSYISIGQNYSPYDASHVLEHEFAHLFQKDDQIAGVDDILGNINLKENKDLNSISLKSFLNNYNPFIKKIEDVGYSTTGSIYGTGSNNLLKKKGLINQKDYWKYGSSGKEKAAFAAEVRENLLQRNILKNRYDPITPEMLEKHYKLYQNTKGDKYNLRLYDIMTQDKNNFKTLSEALNRMPAFIPPAAIATGAGLAGAGSLEQRKNGGYIEAELSDKELKELKAQGYIIEEIN